MLKSWLIGNQDLVKSNSFIWNAIAAALNAGQSAVILFFVTREFGVEMAGVVTIGYALANLFQTIGRYGLRNYQVTDADEKFSFSDYFYSRVISVGGTLAIAGVYLLVNMWFGNYSFEKCMVILEITILKSVEAFVEVYVSRYQQRGRLDIGSKIHAVELVVSTVLMCTMFLFRANIYLAFFLGIVGATLTSWYCIRSTYTAVGAHIYKINFVKTMRLLQIGFPLCVGLSLYMYIGNAPKYLIDIYMDESSQAIFGYIMMPMFVISLLNNFLLQPVVKDLGVTWDKRNLRIFKKMVLRQTLVIFLLAVFVLFAGVIIGLPFLSLFYGLDLTGYWYEFGVLMFGGMFYTVAYYLSVVMTAMRKQNFIVAGYVAAVVVYLFGGRMFISAGGMEGAAWLYLAANAITGMAFLAVVINNIRKQRIEG